MQKRFASIDVLKTALEEGDCRTVWKCIKAGQSLNALAGPRKLPLILHFIQDKSRTAVLTLLAFREFVDIDIISPFAYGSMSALSKSWNDAVITNALIQSGASLKFPQMWMGHPFVMRVEELVSEYSILGDDSIQNILASTCMLLAAGMAPDVESMEVMKF